MARFTGPRERINRRFGVPIFGASKYLERKNYPPGIHGPRSRRKTSQYGEGLLQKQRLRYQYGLLERQFRRVFEKARKKRGVTGETLLKLLESRLDNVVYHLGFANTRMASRQLVSHGHIRVNGRRVGSPSYTVRPNDLIEVKNSPVTRQLITKNLEANQIRPVPAWLSLQREQVRAVVSRLPMREEIQPLGDEQAVVEFYSR